MRFAPMAVLLIGLPVYAIAGDVYRTVDAQGRVQYSDTPVPGATLVHMHSSGNTADEAPQANGKGPAQGSTHGTASNTSTATIAGDPVSEQLAKEAAARKVQADYARAHAEDCRKAQDNYQHLIQAHRIFTTAANGERQYMDDAQAEQARVKAAQDVDAVCKK